MLRRLSSLPTTICEARRPMIERYSDHAANERTFLAWVRTAIAIMAFGFLVQKFDLFLRIAAIAQRAVPFGGQSNRRRYRRPGADRARWRGDGLCRDPLPQNHPGYRCQRGTARPRGAAGYYTRLAAPPAGGHLIRLSGVHGDQSALSAAQRLSWKNSALGGSCEPVEPRHHGTSRRSCAWSVLAPLVTSRNTLPAPCFLSAATVIDRKTAIREAPADYRTVRAARWGALFSRSSR
jgi:hypothetical protein